MNIKWRKCDDPMRPDEVFYIESVFRREPIDSLLLL